MRKTLPLLLLLAACHSAPKSPGGLLTKDEFAEKLLDTMESHFPKIRFSPRGDSLIVFPTPDSSLMEIPVSMRFEWYRARPEDLADILRSCVLTMEGLDLHHNPSGPFCIVPVIHSVNRPKDSRLICEPYTDSLEVLYAFDEGWFWYINDYRYAWLGLSHDYFRRIARDNLSRFAEEFEVMNLGHVYKVFSGSTANASLLLLDSLWDKKHFPVRGDLVAAVPASDVLLVTGSGERKGLENMQRIVDRTWRVDTNRVSRHFFRRVGSTWR